jgi:hypothetical protein
MSEWQIGPGDFKRYPHFDQVLKPDEIKALVTDPVRVAQNTFFPLLLYTKKWQPFRPDKTGSKPRPKPKDRPIRYASRRDAYIFAYYRHLLAAPYEAELERLGISHCPVAYRRVPTQAGSLRGKCNIQFAHDAVNTIRQLGNCCAIAVDISSYFESLDHERLRTLWCRLLGVDRLPADHFAVFKNITKYRVVDRIAAYTRLGYYGVKSFTKGGHPVNGYLVPYKDVPTQLCSSHDFRQKILGENGEYKSLVKPNENVDHGIPQGAPISDLLANLYLIDFDVEMNELAVSLGGSYVRYSDDILLILPVSVEEAQSIMGELPSRISKFGDKLVIKPEKSSLIQYEVVDGGQRHALIAGKGKNGLEYLGFRYDGKNVFLRDSTMSNLYRKVASVARNHAEATVKRYPGKSYADLCDMFNFEQFSKRFGKVEGFEPSSSKTWTFWTYVVRSAEEFGPMGKKITGQVARLKRHCRARVNLEIEKALQRKAKRDASGDISLE